MAKKQEIVTKLSADAKGLHGALDTAKSKLTQVGQTAQKTGAILNAAAQKGASSWSMAGMGIASWMRIASTAMGFIGQIAGKFAEIDKTAAALHTTAEGLQRLDKAARDAGTDTQVLRDAYSKFNNILVSAQRGSAKAQKNLATLGLTAKDLGTDGEKAFLAAAQKLTEMGGAIGAGDAQMRLFGDSTERLSRALAQAAVNGQSLDGIVPEAEIKKMSALAASWSGIKDDLGNMAGTLLAKPAGLLETILGATSGRWYREQEGKQQQELAAYQAQLDAERKAKEQAERRKAAEARRYANEQAAWQKEQDRIAEEEKLAALQAETRMDEDRAAREEEIRRASLTDYERWLEDRHAAWKDAQKSAGMTAAEAEIWIDNVWDKAHVRPEEMRRANQSLKISAAYLQTLSDKENKWYAEAAVAARQAALEQQRLNQAAADYRPPEIRRDEFRADRAGRRFAEAKDAADRARNYRDRADDLRAQAQEAKDNGDRKAYRRLTAQAEIEDKKADTERRSARNLRRRAKRDEKLSYISAPQEDARTPSVPNAAYRSAVQDARRNAKNEPYQWRNTTPVEPVEQDDIGQYGRGNIDLYDRPRYVNEDGSVSTVRSMSFNDGESEVLVPTISRDENNRPILMSDDEAIDHYYTTGEHLGKFSTPEEATAYAEKLHKQQEALYTGTSLPIGPRASAVAPIAALPQLPQPENYTQQLSQILTSLAGIQRNIYVVE